MEKRGKKLRSLLRGLFLPVLFAAVLVYFIAAADQMSGGQQEETLRQIEEILRQSCVACYASEGVYPPNLEYLKEHYGLQIDETRYAVFYVAFAENLMPEIAVLEKEP